MHDLKIHFGPCIKVVCSWSYVFYSEEDGGKGMRAERAGKRKQLPVADYVNFPSQRTGEQ